MLPVSQAATVISDQVTDMLAQRQHPVFVFWRAEGFRRSEGLPMTLRRAHALNAILEQVELVTIPGDLLLGAKLGRMSAEAPDADALEKACAYVHSFGRRYFGTGFDHQAPDYPTLLREGFAGLRAQAEATLARQDDPEQAAFMQSVLLALDGASHFIRRWADEAARLADMHPEWQSLYRQQAEMLRHIATEPPRTFWEALQLVLLAHTMLQLDERYAMALGRIDQYLYPFYAADLAEGRLTADEMQRLLDHYFAKIATRDEVQNHTIGGVTPDGRDGTNPVSEMVLEAVSRIGRVGGNVTARIHEGTPQAFLLKCAEVIRTGIGYPAVYNDAVQIPALTALGYPPEDARDYCFVGCIEVAIAGRHAPWADSRFNLLACVDRALWNGKDSLTEAQVGPDTGEPATWDAFYTAFLGQMHDQLQRHVEAMNADIGAAQAQASALTAPLLSALTADCLARGRDLCDGGARYPGNFGVACMGIGSTADALMAIKRFVYEERRFTLDELRRMLAANFAGYEAERRLLRERAPKYGNDELEVDALAGQAARDFGARCLQYRTPAGGQFWSLMAANTSNIDGGKHVGATPDGRLAGQPLSDAGSPTFGCDLNGPTAVVQSISRVDYRWHPGGNVINMKFHPSALHDEAGLAGLAALIRTCFKLGGSQLQFNTTDRAVLKDAMLNPERYLNLVVRVSGFSGYFVELPSEVQEDVLARTEHHFA